MLGEIIRQNVIPFILAFVAVCTIIGPTASFINIYVYYAAMALFAITSLGNDKLSFKITYIFLLLGAIASLIANDIPSLFNAWKRFLYFILMSIPISPMIESRLLRIRRLKAFHYILWFSAFIGVSSFFCYLMGINYMYNFMSGEYSVNLAGWFGGITVHSMLLGPVSALGATYMAWYSMCTHLSSKRNRLILLICVFLCIAAAMLSASRSSTVAAIIGCVVVYMLRNGKVGSKITGSLFGLLLIGILIQPLLEPFSAMVMEKQNSNVVAGGTFESRKGKWQNRIEEFESNPLFGCGFAVVDVNSGDYSDNGVIEPGSSWLAVLSMLGIVGVICIWVIVFQPMIRIYKRCNKRDVLFFSIFCVFLIHMFTEGYIFAGGSFMFFYFWLFAGSVHAYLKVPKFNLFNQ